MPFDGNRWDRSKLVSQADILEKVSLHFSQNLLKLEDQSNDTSRNYQLENFCGSFAIISSVTNPFCDSCNRIRLTANGKIKNCLFSNNETDLLTSWRNDGPIESLIAKAIQAKHQYRAGMNDMEQLSDPKLHLNNRSMITIGG